MDLGKVGIWTFALDLHPASVAQEAAAELEELGFRALWIPEAMSREIFTNAGILLAGTKKLIVASGIANIWGRDPLAMSAAQKTLTEAYPERFLLGLGVSHAPMVGMRGHNYDKPLSAMRSYLDAMDNAPFMAFPPSTEPRRIIAALAPKMLQLAGERSLGSHPYFVPPEHTLKAREILGAGKWLCPEQAVVFDSNAETARAIARAHMAIYLGLPNYANNLKRLGFTDDDIAHGGSDRLVDAVVAWGEMDAILARIKAHLDAGADHVCVQVLDPDPRNIPLRQWRELAAAVL